MQISILCESVPFAKMSLSKKALCGSLSKKTLTLAEKIKLLDYKKGNPKASCREIAEIFNVGKTSVSTIIKKEESIRKNFASFKGNAKRARHGKYHLLNEAMFNWYKKCCDGNLYPTGELYFRFNIKMNR